MASYTFLLEKLRIPHSSVQRYAVKSIFDTLKSGPSHLSLHSQTGQSALFQCLTSDSLPVLDEAVSQLCSLMLEGHLRFDQGLLHLQVALESAGKEAVATLVRSIGFACRLLLKQANDDEEYRKVLQGFQAYKLHPFVKAFETRRETHLEIVQQVVIMFAQDDLTQDSECVHFLKPFLNYVLLHPSTSEVHAIASLELHFNLASLASSNFHVGEILLALLIQYIPHYSLQRAQEAERVLIALRELVDALESVVKQSIEQAKVDQFKQITRNIFASLVEVCHELKRHRISLLSILGLLRRVVDLQKIYLHDGFCMSWGLISLAHMLAMTDLEEEQLLLLCLARSLFRILDPKGVDVPDNCLLASPAALLWVFPTVNVMSSSSTLLKEAAATVLQDLEKVLETYWTGKKTDVSMQTFECHASTTHGQLAATIHKILKDFWSNKETCETWISIGSDTYWLPTSKTKNRRKAWLQRLSHHLEKLLLHNSKQYSTSQFDAYKKKGFLSWLCMVVSAILIHPVVGIDTIEVISAIGKREPIWGLSLLPVILFYAKARGKHWRKNESGDLFGLLKVLPSLAWHPMTSSMVTQTLQPMLDSRCNPVLQATAIRLLCKTWETSGKVFPYLKVVLEQAPLSVPMMEYQIRLSRAATICDICKKDADCGVELVLSIQECIESKDPSIRALGLQSLSWLCQSDVIDFYTAWAVIGNLLPETPSDYVLEESLCQFLQNGALDAAAYPNDAQKILEHLWKSATMSDDNNEADRKWWLVREISLKALSSYEVKYIEMSIADTLGKHVQILLSEVLPKGHIACEELIVKFLLHEYKSRHRAQEEKKPVGNKAAKILTALPRILSASVPKENFTKQYPAVCLLSNPYSPIIPSDMGRGRFEAKLYLKNLQAWVADREQQFCEIANNIDLSKNLISALLCLQSWSSFMTEWLEARISIDNFLHISENLDNPSSIEVMKVLCRICEEGVPRVAENAILALAVLYQVAETTPDSLGLPIVKYLESHLAQDGHEYLQWTSAIALGIVARCFPATEWRLKSDITRCLLQCLHKSDRDIVRGACSVALGFLCQSLIGTNDVGDSVSNLIGRTREEEMSILSVILEDIINRLSHLCPAMLNHLQKIGSYDLRLPGQKSQRFYFEQITGEPQRDEECIWSVAGLAMALGSSVIAIERAGMPTLVSLVTELLIQEISTFDSKLHIESALSFSIGSFIALPTCLESCLRLELLSEKVEYCLQKVKSILSHCKDDGSFPAPLIMAASIGSGNLLATILCHGTHGVPLEDIHELLNSLKSIAGGQTSAISSLGGFIGLANSFGSGAALLAPLRQHRVHVQRATSTMGRIMEERLITNPLLYESSCEELMQNLVQELMGSALHASDASLRSSAGWSLALMRKASVQENDIEHTFHVQFSTSSHKSYPAISLSSFPKDSTLYLLCSWLLNLGKMLESSAFPYSTAISVLRCLQRAPQLPLLDWGTLIRQIMHKMATEQAPSGESVDTSSQHVAMQDNVCKELLLFLLAHAEKLPILQPLLDELCDLSRLISLGPFLSGLLMLHMASVSSIFSESRMERFFIDCVELISRVCRLQDSEPPLPKTLYTQLKINFWKGLALYVTQLNKQSKETSEAKKHKLFLRVEKCLEVFDDLPLVVSVHDHDQTLELDSQLLYEEWSAALNCISQASKEWILKITEFEWKQPPVTKDNVKAAHKAFFIMSQMVARGSLPPSVLMRPVQCLCNQEASRNFQQFLWATFALEGISLQEKQGWLIESIETAFLLKNPDTALLFFALLTSSWSMYASVLHMDSEAALEDLLFTLPSLLSEASWITISNSILQKCMAVVDKFVRKGSKMSSSLFYLKQASIALRKQLSIADQVKLAEECMTLFP